MAQRSRCRCQFAQSPCSGIHLVSGHRGPASTEGVDDVGLILAVLLLVLILGGLGFAIHLLWIVAVIAFLIWLIGFFVSGAERRWYHW